MKDNFKFKLTDIKEEGARLSATVTDAEGSEFYIAVGFCDANIKVNTSGKWNNEVYQAAGILHEMKASGKGMQKELVVTDEVLKKWQTFDTTIHESKSDRPITY